MRWTSPLLAASLILGLAAPAMAASQPGARLVTYHGEICLLVSGQRDNPASAVRIEGHEVPVEGSRTWRARLPVATLRQWATPFARRIAINIAGQDSPTMADLPIGLLGHTTDLAALTIGQR
ncbi:hypothetical protein [Novosphingobium rosa]|uniref:hypothetical protein n=1 Tax=Novosphingobium rosa TaxID=76978 RepID=UPI000833B0E2|nr:hypothetical protein [Novosphingobium rosa]